LHISFAYGAFFRRSICRYFEIFLPILDFGKEISKIFQAEGTRRRQLPILRIKASFDPPEEYVNKVMKKPRIRPPHRVIVRAPGLLPMLYKVSELAEEVGVPDSTMRGWLDLGAPLRHDSGGHLWIHGQDFASWVERMRRPRREGRLADDEAFCMSCRRVVTMKKPVWKPIKGKLVHITGKCPDCGCMIQRGGRVAGSG
jgi:hypothetical protein